VSTPTPDFYPGGMVPFSAVVYARAFGYASALLLESARGRLRMHPAEVFARTSELVRTGNELLKANCGSVVYDFMEGLLLGVPDDSAAARDLRAAIPEAWHKLYSDNAAHIAASRGGLPPFSPHPDKVQG